MLNSEIESVYDNAFYESRRDFADASSHAIVLMLNEMFSPQDVIDIGCGEGHFLRQFKELGVNSILGLDGDYVSHESLAINNDEFLASDLCKADTIKIPQKYDLAICLEVAEHIPAECSNSFVQLLTRASDAVVFSAAIPGQGGVGHINCKWPPYWANLFSKYGYSLLDPFRKHLWQLDGVAPWYQQNIFLYANHNAKEKYPFLNNVLNDVWKHPTLIDPRIAWRDKPTIKESLVILKDSIKRSLCRKFGVAEISQ